MISNFMIHIHVEYCNQFMISLTFLSFKISYLYFEVWIHAGNYFHDCLSVFFWLSFFYFQLKDRFNFNRSSLFFYPIDFIHVFFYFYSLRILKAWWMKFLNSISAKCFYSLPFSQLDDANIWQQYCTHKHTHRHTYNKWHWGETIIIILGVP